MKEFSVLVTALMAKGTFEAKIVPLIKLDSVSKIYIYRKTPAELKNDKLAYLKVPRLATIPLLFNLSAPFLIAFYARKYNTRYIIGYHFIPYGIIAYLASILSGKDFIYGQTGIKIQDQYNSNKILRLTLNLVLRRAKIINVPGSFSRNFWIEEAKIEGSKINVLHSTIDTDHYHYKCETKIWDFIYVGRLSAEKQVYTLIEMFNRFSKMGIKFSSVIVGDGPKLNNIKGMIMDQKLEGIVTVTGFVDNVSYYLNRSKISLLNSTGEGMPTGIMQSMACELIVIASSVGNLPDLITNSYNGYLFQKGDNVDFYNKAIFALQNYESLNSIRKNARETIISSHSYLNAVQKWNYLLKE